MKSGTPEKGSHRLPKELRRTRIKHASDVRVTHHGQRLPLLLEARATQYGRPDSHGIIANHSEAASGVISSRCHCCPLESLRLTDNLQLR
jgi:hypothetical protein